MSYEPTFPGEAITPQWLYDELQRIGTEMARPDKLLREVLHIAPARPQEGLEVCADGTDWNPGAGAGLYLYIGAAWHKL